MKCLSFIRFALVLVLFFSTAICRAQLSVQMSKVSAAQKMVDAYFAKGKLPPFTFVYGGECSSDFIRKWNFSKKRVESDLPNVLKYEILYSEPGNGLEVRCDVTGYQDFEALEWVLHFTNRGDGNSKNIKNLAASDILFASKNKDFTIYTAHGSNGSRYDFAPVVVDVESDTLYAFEPKNGRSSDTSAFPFFNITSGGNGVMLSVGWTGTWFADFALVDGRLQCRSGMRNTDLFLYPGESIRTPLVSLMYWKGDDRLDGQNRFRRFILAHHTHKINGKNIVPPMCGGFEWGDPAPCNEYTCLTEEMAVAMVKRHKQFGLVPEVFWLDAGWYEGAGGPNFEGRNWYNTVGSWRVDRERFPNGLKPISEAAHDMGAKLMVWFEPERVYKGSYFYNNYPQWLIKSESSNNAIFDLGNKEACDFLCKYIGDFIEENGIDYYRQDFNCAIDGFWALKDKADGRKGMSEIRHIEGLYRFWDYLLARFPNMLIDNCASGGRRLDLETTSRSIPLWRTDYNYGEPNGYQNHTHSLNMFLPLNGTGTYTTKPYNWRSSISSSTGHNWAITAHGTFNIKDAQSVMEKFKVLRNYFLEDFYPLSGDGDLTGDDKCLAYQLNRPSDNSGYLFAFRRGKDAAAKMVVKLRGLVEEKIYTVVDEDSKAEFTRSGKELMDGVEIVFDNAPASVLLFYK